MIRRRKPLDRGTTPLKRTPLRRSQVPLKRTPIVRSSKIARSRFADNRPSVIADHAQDPATLDGRRYLTGECDRLFSLIIRRPGRCEVCGTTRNLECAHGISRRYRATRWDLRNAVCLCHADHVWFTEKPDGWLDFLRARWGDDLYAEMHALAQSGIRPDLRVLVEELRGQAAA